MISALIEAEKKCNKQIDIKPDKVLRPIGYVYKEWCECESSTELPHWIWWEVVGESKSWRGTGLYERMNEIKRFWFMDVRG